MPYLSIGERLARKVEAHADRCLAMAVAAGEGEVDLRRDYVREVVELERALMRDDGDLGAGEHPGGSDVVERRRRVKAQAVESAAGVLEASALAGVVPEGVAVEACLLCLRGGHVAALRLLAALVPRVADLAILAVFGEFSCRRRQRTLYPFCTHHI